MIAAEQALASAGVAKDGHRCRRLRDDDAELFLSRQRPRAAGADGISQHPDLRHPAAVLGIPVCARPGGLAHPVAQASRACSSSARTCTRRSCRGQNGWDYTIGRGDGAVTPEQYDHNTRLRDRTVLFGDGAGAVVMEARDGDDRGFLGSRLFSDGSNIEALYIPGAGFRDRPFVTHEQLDAGLTVPVMEGKAVFKEAVTRMPEAVRAVCADAGIEVGDARPAAHPPGEPAHHRGCREEPRPAAGEGAAQHRAVRQHHRRDAADPLPRVRGEGPRHRRDAGVLRRSWLRPSLGRGALPGVTTDVRPIA